MAPSLHTPGLKKRSMRRSGARLAQRPGSVNQLTPCTRVQVWFLHNNLALTYCAAAAILPKYMAEQVSTISPLHSDSAPKGGDHPKSAPPLREYYDSLLAALGPQNWWPAQTPFKVIVGAILTQGTAWTNVERALENLRREQMLSIRAIENAPLRRLASAIRPSGYFRQKAKKLKAFIRFLRDEYDRSLARMFRTPTGELRGKLLHVHGIGPETADAILLYAGGHPSFVVDAYTKRILLRHGWIGEKASYGEVQSLFERNIPREVARYNEFHALIVRVAKNWCHAREAHCSECPLGRFISEER
jgi:endonuclease III related protein